MSFKVPSDNWNIKNQYYDDGQITSVYCIEKNLA